MTKETKTKKEVVTPVEKPVDIVDSLLESTYSLTTSVKTERLAGIESNVYSYTTEVKDKDGNIQLVTRTVRGQLAVKAMSLLDKLIYLEGQSAKLIVLSMAKLTKKDAEGIGKKSVKDLILDRFPKYDGNTIDRYRKLGLLFSADRKNPDNFEWCDGIPSDTSVTNLDCMIRVLQLKDRKDSNGKQISLEKLSDKEIEKLRDEVLHYVILNELHPSASLAKVREEVALILKEKKGDVINTTATVKDEGNDEGKDEGKDEGQNDKLAQATKACEIIAQLYGDNDIIKTAVVQILEQLNIMLSE